MNDHEVRGALGWGPGGAAPLSLAEGAGVLVDEALLDCRAYTSAAVHLTSRIPHSRAELTSGASAADGL